MRTGGGRYSWGNATIGMYEQYMEKKNHLLLYYTELFNMVNNKPVYLEYL